MSIVSSSLSEADLFGTEDEEMDLSLIIDTEMKETGGESPAKKDRGPGGRGRPRDEDNREKELEKHKQDDKQRDGRFQRLLTLVAKLSLNTSLRARILSSIILCNMLVNSTCELAIAMQEGGKKFAAEHSEASASRREAMGLPHCWVWNQALIVAKTCADETLKAAAEAYEKFLRAAPQAQYLSLIGEQCKYCRVSKCYDREKLRIETNFVKGSEAETFFVAMEAFMIRTAGGVKKLGVAPKLNLEKEVQKCLDKMNGNK